MHRLLIELATVVALGAVVGASTAACAADTTPKRAGAAADDKADDDKAGTSSDPTDPAGAADPAAGKADEKATPAGPNDADGEPLVSELAIDPGLGVDCAGPFNCVLPNPAPKDRNRIVNPDTGTNEWPLAPNTEIVDGVGGKRGTVTSSLIKINYGQRKTLLGAPHVYAFAVKTTNGAASSWVLESAVGASLTSMPTVVARDPGKGDYNQVFTLTGGDPAKYGDAKVVPNSKSDNEAATDYLTRPGDVVNFLYALPRNGGVSNDTFPAKGGVKFKRARGVASVYVYLYEKGTTDVVGTQRFVYGHVDGRYGWIARDALEPAAATPGPTMTFCCAKCEKRTALHRVPGANDCTTSATAYCAAEPSRGGYETSSIGACSP